MKLRYWFIILSIILIGLTINSASAITVNNSEAYYSFDNTTIAGTNISDLSGNGHWATNTETTWIAGKLIDARHYDGINDNIKVHDLLFDGTGNWTYSFWVKYTTAVDVQTIMSITNAAANNIRVYANRNEADAYEAGQIQIRTNDGVNAYSSPTANHNLNDGNWHYIVFVYDDTANTGQWYINGSSVATSGSVRGGDVWNTGFLKFGANPAGTSFMNVDIDEYGFYKRKLNATEITYLWNGGTGRNPYTGIPPTPDTINLSNSTPLNRSQFNTNPVTFWVLGNASLNWTCRLYINGTVNQTQTLGIGNDINCSFQVNITQSGNWNYSFRGNTTSTDENTTTNIFYYDDISPVITIINWSNGTIRYNNNITGSWNITDNLYLYRLNASIDGSQIFGVTEINSTQYTYNLTSNVTGLTPGNHTLSIQVADGHTALSIPEYDWSNGLFNDYLQYNTKDASIRIEALDGSILDSFKTVKLKDRYTFSYEPWDTKKSSYYFHVASDLPISIVKLPNSTISEITQWVISGDHWLDFYIPGTTAEITRLDKYNVRVEVTGFKDASKLDFSSIGDLNIVTRNYTFVTTNMTLVYATSVNELSYQTSTLTIFTPAGILNTSAAFFWNNSYRTISADRSNASQHFYNITFLTPAINQSVLNVPFLWYYNVTGTINNITGLLNNTQKVIQIGIDNCSLYTTRAVNITVFDEDNSSPIVASINGYFNVWVGVLSAFREFNLTWAGNSTYGICINNATTTYQTNSQLEYYNPTHNSKTYYMTNYTLDNTTEQLDLYLTLNTTLITITVTDETDNPIQDAYVHIQTYDVGTNTYKTTEIIKTGYQGQAFAEMVLYNKWYQFMVVYQGVTVLQTEPTKLTSTELNLRINLGSIDLSSWRLARQVTCSISFNNVTNNFRMDFSNPSGVPILATLKVYNVSLHSQKLFNQSSLNSAGGTILVNIGTPANITYSAQGSITTSNETFVCGTPVSVSYGADFQTWGLQGLFYLLLMLITVTCVFVFGPEIAVAASTATIAVGWYLGLLGLTAGTIVTIVIIGGIVIYRMANK